MHGITPEVKLDLVLQGTDTDPWGNERAGAEIQGFLNRKDFDMKFNQALGSGNLLVGDKVRISLDVSAILKEYRNGSNCAARPSTRLSRRAIGSTRICRQPPDEARARGPASRRRPTETITAVVSGLTGKPPRTFAEFAPDYSDALLGASTA